MNIETAENSVICCRRCGETKIRYLKGKRGKDKIWVDETGKELNGHTCAQCNVERVTKNKRHKVKLDKAIAEAFLKESENG